MVEKQLKVLFLHESLVFSQCRFLANGIETNVCVFDPFLSTAGGLNWPYSITSQTCPEKHSTTGNSVSIHISVVAFTHFLRLRATACVGYGALVLAHSPVLDPVAQPRTACCDEAGSRGFRAPGPRKHGSLIRNRTITADISMASGNMCSQDLTRSWLVYQTTKLCDLNTAKGQKCTS